MKKKLLAVLFASCLLLSACGKAAPEAGSQPGTASQPTSSSTGTTAPPTTATTAPPTTASPINQEVTPQGSFPESEVWTGSKQFRYVDAERLDPRGEEYEILQPLDTMKRVYYGSYMLDIVEYYPDDSYFAVALWTTPTVKSLYGDLDGSEECEELRRSTTEELWRRMKKAGYHMLYDEDSWLWHHLGGIRYVVTVMSVAEMKALNCGDDLSVEIRAFLPSQLPPVA